MVFGFCAWNQKLEDFVSGFTLVVKGFTLKMAQCYVVSKTTDEQAFISTSYRQFPFLVSIKLLASFLLVSIKKRSSHNNMRHLLSYQPTHFT